MLASANKLQNPIIKIVFFDLIEDYKVETNQTTNSYIKLKHFI